MQEWKRVSGAGADASDEEWKLRVELAAAYRLCALYGWDDQISTHISVRIPGPEHHFLINPFGLFFDEINASSLVKIDLHGDPVDPTPHRVNKAGFIVHSAIHRSCENAKCVLHLHTVSGISVSVQERGLMPLSMPALRLYGRIGYHDFEGITVNRDEQSRLVANLGDNIALFLRNHGTITIGNSVAEAFHRAYSLERACQIQISALSSGDNPRVLAAEMAELVRSQSQAGFSEAVQWIWEGLIRKLDRLDTSYRD